MNRGSPARLLPPCPQEDAASFNLVTGRATSQTASRPSPSEAASLFAADRPHQLERRAFNEGTAARACARPGHVIGADVFHRYSTFEFARSRRLCAPGGRNRLPVGGEVRVAGHPGGIRPVGIQQGGQRERVRSHVSSGCLVGFSLNGESCMVAITRAKALAAAFRPGEAPPNTGICAKPQPATTLRVDDGLGSASGAPPKRGARPSGCRKC